MAMDSLRDVLRARKRWSAYLLTFDSSEAFGAFLVIENDEGLDDASYWRILGDAWTASDAIAANEAEWRRLFSSDRPGRENLTREPDRAVLADLPEEVTVYRGHSHDGGERGLAWTLSRESAEIFARQFATSTDMGHPPGDPRVATAVVPREAIIAMHQHRRPGDVVILDLPDEIQVEKLEDPAA
jgi:hypothetical protein